MTIPHITVKQLGTAEEGLAVTFNPNTVNKMELVTGLSKYSAERDVIMSFNSSLSGWVVGPNGASTRPRSSDTTMTLLMADGARREIEIVPVPPLKIDGPLKILDESPQEPDPEPSPPEPEPTPTPTPDPSPAPSPDAYKQGFRDGYGDGYTDAMLDLHDRLDGFFWPDGVKEMPGE